MTTIPAPFILPDLPKPPVGRHVVATVLFFQGPTPKGSGMVWKSVGRLGSMLYHDQYPTAADETTARELWARAYVLQDDHR